MRIVFGAETSHSKRPVGTLRLGGGLSIRMPGLADAAPMGTERTAPKPTPSAVPQVR